MGRYALNVISYFIKSRTKNRHHLRGKSIVQTSARWLSWLSIGLVERLTIISKLKEFADIVANPKWLLLHIHIDHIAIANVWLKITKIGSKQRIIGIGKVVLPKNNVGITYTKATKNGGRQYSSEMAILAKAVEQTKVAYWLPTISRNERTIPNYCLMQIMA